MIVFIAAIDSVKFSSKSELSSRFFGRLKIFARFEYLSLEGETSDSRGFRPHSGRTLGKQILINSHPADPKGSVDIDSVVNKCMQFKDKK